MKRIIAYALAAVCAMSFLPSCGHAVAPQVNISSAGSSEVAADVKNLTVELDSNVDWTATSSESWCTLSSPGQAGGGARTLSGQAGESVLILNLEPNTEYEPRTATVTISAGGVEKKVTVTQEAAVGLVVDGVVFEAPKEGGPVTIPVQSNVEYSVETGADWLSVVSSKALGSHTITLEAEGNFEAAERSATVTIAGGGLTRTVTINQQFCEKLIVNYVWNTRDDTQITNRYVTSGYRGWWEGKASGYYISISTDEISPDLMIVSEDAADWLYQSSDVYYNSYANDYIIYFMVAANPGQESRTGHVRVVTVDGKYSSAEITVEQLPLPQHAIDLGLDVYWHDMNLGANSPGEYGDYYAWGELEPKTTYTWDTYNCNGGDRYSTYSGNSYTYRLWDEDDAAASKLNPNGRNHMDAFWQMPSKYDFEELIATKEHPETHKWEWKEIGGHNGWQITCLENGNSIFLPAAGYIFGSSDVNYAGTLGLYWSSYPVPYVPQKAYYLRFEPGPDGEVAVFDDGLRAAGKPIRPVTD